MNNVGIIGGGVSGVISAIYASKNGNKVTILEKNNDILKKLLITGSGRCNYFNSDQNIKHYHSKNEEYLKEIITKENTDELCCFYDSIGIVPKIKDGYYYPYSNMAISIKNALVNEVLKSNIKVICNYDVKSVDYKNNEFIINNDKHFDKLIISTGSKAYPKTGSDGFGYSLVKKLGHTINEVKPALVSLWSDDKILNIISGVRANAKISLYHFDELLKEEIGEVQFVKNEVSGICTFNLSYLVTKNNNVRINFMPFIKLEEYDDFMLKNNNKRVKEILNGILNPKLIQAIIKRCNINEEKYFYELSKKEKDLLKENLISFRIDIKGKGPFDKAQICMGGVPLNEIDIKSMKSKINENLYITGEMLDVNGDCGGYNLTFAFISGYLSGKDIK